MIEFAISMGFFVLVLSLESISRLLLRIAEALEQE